MSAVGRFVLAVCRACLRRQGLAFLAFAASIMGAGVLSGLLAWNIYFLQQEKRATEIATLSYGLLLLIGIVLISSHRLLGSKLAIEAEILSAKLKISQGCDTDEATS